MTYFHLTCSQFFGGIKDKKTYYHVKESDVENTCRFMCQHFNVDVVFIYKTPIEKRIYVGSYSRKYDNFKINGKYSKIF